MDNSPTVGNYRGVRWDKPMGEYDDSSEGVCLLVFSLRRRILSADSPGGADCTICSDSIRGVPRSISQDHVPRITEGFVDRGGESLLRVFSFSITLICEESHHGIKTLHDLVLLRFTKP